MCHSIQPKKKFFLISSLHNRFSSQIHCCILLLIFFLSSQILEINFFLFWVFFSSWEEKVGWVIKNKFENGFENVFLSCWPKCKCEVQIINFLKNRKKIDAHLCWRKLSGRLKCFPHTSHENAISGLLCVRSWIIKLYDFVNRRWQYLHTYSHFGRILRRKSSLSIFNTVNILDKKK